MSTTPLPAPILDFGAEDQNVYTGDQVRACIAEATASLQSEVERLRKDAEQAKRALIRARDGYISEGATGLPVLEFWRQETLRVLNEAIDGAAIRASTSR